MSEKEITFQVALREALYGAMTKDPNLILIGEDVGPWGGSHGVSRGLCGQRMKSRAQASAPAIPRTSRGGGGYVEPERARRRSTDCGTGPRNDEEVS